MSKPNLNVPFCIVCEDIRPEMHGKYAILGFFGQLPFVKIRLQDMEKPVARLVFLLNIDGDAGEYAFKFTIMDPKGKPFHKVDLAAMKLSGKMYERSLAAVSLAGLEFKSEGDYKVRLLHKNKGFYESAFRIEIGSPEVFAT